MTAPNVFLDEARIAELLRRAGARSGPSVQVTQQVYTATLAAWRAANVERASGRSLWKLWWRHEWAPLVAFVLLAAAFAMTHADVTIARTLFFDRTTLHWIGTGNWWVNDVVHVGGRWFVHCIVAVALVTWLLTYRRPGLRWLRRPTAYFVLAVVLSVGTVGLLKVMTNVHCPWDLTEFGGRFPEIALFASRPAGLSAGHCFPAAHASSGYALLALYFVLRERRSVLAKAGLALGLMMGLVFGIAQQMRGAHFVSHDVWSAFLVWTISLSVYVFAFKARLWD